MTTEELIALLPAECAEQIRQRLADQSPDDLDEGDEHATAIDMVEEFMGDCDEREHWTHDYRRELNALGVKLGIHREVTAEDLANTWTNKGPAKPDFRMGGKMYKFWSWEPLRAIK